MESSERRRGYITWCSWKGLYNVWSTSVWWYSWIWGKSRWGRWNNSRCYDYGWVGIPLFYLLQLLKTRRIIFTVISRVTMNIGAVSDLRRIPNAISVARKVLHNTAHTMLAGDQATKFAVQMGFKEQTLTTNKSHDIWSKWKRNNCQPNFWRVSIV